MTTEMSDIKAKVDDPEPGTVSPEDSEQLAGPQAPEPAPKAEKTPRKARTRGVPAVPAALAGANTVAVAGGYAASIGGPAAGFATAGAMVAGAVGLGLRQRRRVRRSMARRAARDVARRNGMAVSPAAVRSGRWTPTQGGGGSSRTPTGNRNSGTGPTRSRSVKSPAGSSPTRSGSGGTRSKGPGKHRRSGSGLPGSGSAGPGPTRRNRSGSDRTDSPRSRRLDRQRSGPTGVRPGRLRQVIGPRPAGSTRGGLINRGDGTRRQPIRTTANAARAVGRGAQRVGRGTVRAWNSRPARAARRWSIGATRRAWGVIGPAIGATLSGVGAAMRRRGWRGMFQAMGQTWRNLRARWAPNSRHAQAAAAATPPPPSAPADTVERPEHATTGTRPTGGPARLTGGVSMQQARIIEATREMVGAAMMYNPEGMMQIGNDFASFPEIIRNVASSIQHMTRQVQEGETPMHPAIVDQVKALHMQLVNLAASAEDLRPAFENLHAVDIKRIREPRPGEEMWDLSANREHVGR